MKRSLAEGAPQTKAEDKRPKVEQKGVGSEPRGVLYVPTDKDKVEAAALESVGLPDPDVVAQQQGGGPVRLEVYWVLEPLGGEGEAEGKWWGCEVRRVAEDELRRDAEGRAVFRLLYDAFNGFEAEERRAVFTSPAQLIDVKEGTEMDWRLEGEEQEDDEGDLPLPLGPGVVDMMQVAALQERIHQEQGIDASVTEALSDMPMAQQVHFAEGFRSMVDKLKEKLRDFQRDKTASGQEAVVSEQDMHRIILDLKGGASLQPP